MESRESEVSLQHGQSVTPGSSHTGPTRTTPCHSLASDTLLLSQPGPAPDSYHAGELEDLGPWTFFTDQPSVLGSVLLFKLKHRHISIVENLEKMVKHKENKNHSKRHHHLYFSVCVPRFFPYVYMLECLFCSFLNVVFFLI